MFVKMLGLRDGKQYVMAEVRAVNGQLQIAGSVPPPVLKELEKLLERAVDDEAFLRHLPMDFSGTYVRGQLVD